MRRVGCLVANVLCLDDPTPWATVLRACFLQFEAWLEPKATSGVPLKDEAIVSRVPSTKRGSFEWFVVQCVGVNLNSMATIHKEESMRVVIFINIKVPNLKMEKNSKLYKKFGCLEFFFYICYV